MKTPEVVFELKSKTKKSTLGRIVKKEFETTESVYAKLIEGPAPAPIGPAPKFIEKFEPKFEPKFDPAPAPAPARPSGPFAPRWQGVRPPRR